MLVAEYDGKRIEIQTYSDPKRQLNRNLIRCPCGAHRLLIRAGVVNISHFAHYPKTACNFEKLQGERESPEHQALKLYIVERYRKNHPDLRVSLERRILGGKRIADVLIEYESGNVMAVECQLSRITAGKVLERTEDYHCAGIEVYWIFRESILTDAFVKAISNVLPNIGEVVVDAH